MAHGILGRDRKGIYAVFTTWVVIAVLLASMATLFLVSRLMLGQNAQKSSDRILDNEFDYMRDRFYFCYGNVVNETELLSRLDCLGLRGEMGLSIERLPFADCEHGFVKELNYKGYGKVKMFDIAIDQDGKACPAIVTLYENAVIVPIITDISVTPLFLVRPAQLNTTVWFYHTVYPSFIVQRIFTSFLTKESEHQSGPLFGNISSYSFLTQSSAMDPGIHYVGIGVTHDQKYWDENRKAGRFRVVPENDTPVYEWHFIGPDQGTIHDTFKVVVNLTDYINMSWVAIAVENGSDALLYFNITRSRDMIDMEELEWHFQYAGGIPGSLLPNANATYNVTMVAMNDLDNSLVKHVGEIRIVEVKGFDVAILAIKGYLDQKYTASEVMQLESKLAEFADAITADGLFTSNIYLDSDDLQNLIGTRLSGGPPYTYSQIDGIIQQLYESRNMTYIIIVGGQGIFPLAQINGEDADGRMSYEYTDDLYADMTGDYVPDVAFGRILDPISGDMPLMLKILDNSIRYHQLGGVDFSRYHTDGMEGMGPGTIWSSMICFNQQNWGSTHPANTHTKDFPCNGLSDSSNMGFYGLLMHGSAGKPDDPFTQEFACNVGTECPCRFPGGGTVPSELTPLSLDGAAWMLMPCHGGHVQDKVSSIESMPMMFHKAGGLIYIGSTNNNLGAAMNCQTIGGVVVGDYHVGALYGFISSHFDIGVRVGDAYRDGKRDYATKMPDSGGKQYQQRISCYFGDPTIKIRNTW